MYEIAIRGNEARKEGGPVNGVRTILIVTLLVWAIVYNVLRIADNFPH